MAVKKTLKTDAGLTLIELMVAMAIGLVLMAGIVQFLRQGLDISHLVMQRGEMQQSARAAINIMARDLSIAGTGIPPGGIQLPTGVVNRPRFGCDGAACYTLPNNQYLTDRLYAINPWDGLGQAINGVATDMVTLAYADDRINLNAFPLANINGTGTQITVNPATNPAINDAALGIVGGDVLMLTNTNGSAAGLVTANPANNTIIDMQNLPDPLLFNQPGAPAGSITIMAHPPAAPAFAQTTATRIMIITYYIMIPPGPDAVVGTADDLPPRLMRQVNAQPPAPIADAIRDLQIAYDIYDDNLAVATANQPNAGGFPNQIRKSTVTITFRSPVRGPFRGNFEETSLSTSVSARNLSFRDRYQ